jgi:hypothetical protein
LRGESVTEKDVVNVALQWWRASGVKSRERLESLIADTAAGYESLHLDSAALEHFRAQGVYSWEITAPEYEGASK